MSQGAAMAETQNERQPIERKARRAARPILPTRLWRLLSERARRNAARQLADRSTVDAMAPDGPDVETELKHSRLIVAEA